MFLLHFHFNQIAPKHPPLPQHLLLPAVWNRFAENCSITESSWFDLHSVPKRAHILEPKHVDLSSSGNQQILIFQADIGLIWCSMEKGYRCQFYKCCQVSVCVVSKFVAVEIKDSILCWTNDDDALLDFRSVIYEWLGFNCYIGLCPNESKVNRGGMGNLFLALVIVPAK